MPKTRILLLGLITIIGFPVIAITIVGFVESNPWKFDFGWDTSFSLMLQLIVGLIVGTLFGFLAWWMINRPNLSHIKTKYGILIHNFQLSIWEILFLSFSAGVGEEFLFRGVLQPYWGVWITAVVFVAIHGYLDPRDKNMLSYGLVMTGIIVILGYMKIYFGLISAMSGHFAIDVVLLYKLTNDKAYFSKFIFHHHQPPKNMNDEEKGETSENTNDDSQN